MSQIGYSDGSRARRLSASRSRRPQPRLVEQVTLYHALRQQVLSSASFLSSSPLFADGKIYFQSETGVGNVIRATRKFELLSTNELAERTLASYAVAQQSLLIRSAQNLYRVGKAN